MEEEEFKARFMKHLALRLNMVYESWMDGVADGSWQMYADDKLHEDDVTPEEMADEEYDEMCRNS